MRESFWFWCFRLWCYDTRVADCIKNLWRAYWATRNIRDSVRVFEKIIIIIFSTRIHTHILTQRSDRQPSTMMVINKSQNNVRLCAIPLAHKDTRESLETPSKENDQKEEKKIIQIMYAHWTNAKAMISVRMFAHKLLSRILIFISLALSVCDPHSILFGENFLYIFTAATDDELTMSIKFPFNLWPNIKPILNINYTFWSSIRFFASPIGSAFSRVMDEDDDCVDGKRHTHTQNTEILIFLLLRGRCWHTQKLLCSICLAFRFRSLCWRQSCHCRCHPEHNQIH